MITIPGKIPIHIYPLFWVLILMIGWINSSSLTGTLIWSIVILISVLLHEFGHALTANFFGQQAEISLVGMGGLTSREGGHLNKWKEFLIVLNGPLAGFLLFFILFSFKSTFASLNPYLRYGLEVGIEVNLFWTILNLLPVWPLDGGHLLRILLEGMFGFRGTKIAIIVSLVFAALLGIYAVIFQQLLIGAIFLMFAFESYRAWTEISELHPQDTNTEIQGKYKEALTLAQEGRQDEALSKFLAVREQSQSGILFVAATQEMARILTDKGHYKQAYELLAPIRNQLAIQYLTLLQNLAYRLEEWEHAGQIGTLAYQKQPSIDVALINAFSYAIMGKAKQSVGWLRSAAHLGYPSIKTLIQKREFDSIRQTQEFQSWLKSL